jgi:hypothetical protein
MIVRIDTPSSDMKFLGFRNTSSLKAVEREEYDRRKPDRNGDRFVSPRRLTGVQRLCGVDLSTAKLLVLAISGEVLMSCSLPKAEMWLGRLRTDHL